MPAQVLWARESLVASPCKVSLPRYWVLANLQVWVQQNKTTWSQNSLLKDQLPYLSPEAIDLLDRMFELDEKKRWVRTSCGWGCVGGDVKGGDREGR
jgi:hypothetical protein